MLGNIFCLRFISSRRPLLLGKQREQSENFSKSHKSPYMRPRRRLMPYSSPPSNAERRGGENKPCSARSSIAPFPARVGINETTLAPQSKAKSIDFFNQCS